MRLNICGIVFYARTKMEFEHRCNGVAHEESVSDDTWSGPATREEMYGRDTGKLILKPEDGAPIPDKLIVHLLFRKQDECI